MQGAADTMKAAPEADDFRTRELALMPSHYASRVNPDRRDAHLALILGHPGYPLKSFTQHPLSWDLSKTAGHWRLTIFAQNGPWSMPNVTAAVALHAGSIQKAGLYPRADGTILIETEFTASDAALAAFGRTLQDRFGTIIQTTRDPGCELPRDLDVKGHATDGGTMLEISAADTRGLLFRITRAFALDGIKVLSAEISTTGGVARDRFLVTRRDGRPLDLAADLPALVKEIKREKW